MPLKGCVNPTPMGISNLKEKSQKQNNGDAFIFILSSLIVLPPFFFFDLSAAKIPILYMTWSSTSALKENNISQLLMQSIHEM